MGVIWVAEAGSLHKQNTSLACEMARQAQRAGATIFKIQLGHDPADPVRAVSRDLAFILRDYCRYVGLELMASLFSVEGLELAREMELARYKIAYQKKDDQGLVDAVLSDGKETFITGLQHPDRNTRPIFAVSQYPTYPWEAKMPENFSKWWFGYSDHTHGIEACLLAVARGAQYVEAHFCLDKTDLWTRDSSFAKTPDEFSEMTRIGNGLRRLLDALV